MNAEKKEAFITTNDGVKVAYQCFGSEGPVVVLLHGWSGSRHYYDRNTHEIGKSCRVYAVDLRFHGSSGRPEWGYHVARLAADLHDLLQILDLWDATVVGSSMGASVIWAYIELFGHQHLGKLVFVDQTPLQNNAEDWRLGSLGCYDAASLARLQTTLRLDFGAVARGNLAACLARPLDASIQRALCDETRRACPDALSRLMADHTQLDWRPMLPRIRVPCLNLIGRQSAVFPWQGTEVVGRLVPACRTVVFENCGHWLYLEQPQTFNKLVAEFAQDGLSSVTFGSV
ncbi:hypothetical protein WJX81_002235 [Elliptochloris bilobata]|uniref:AB hydrolase-1 domain-containing protein n=1 Tax=Elliptochloris bilobata TaxID=381761 RepID=A0AAW1RRK0_9CHLO